MRMDNQDMGMGMGTADAVLNVHVYTMVYLEFLL